METTVAGIEMNSRKRQLIQANSKLFKIFSENWLLLMIKALECQMSRTMCQHSQVMFSILFIKI